ncbi:MAG: sodium:solute symporter family transporter, partial [Acinetobacter guillouiae]
LLYPDLVMAFDIAKPAEASYAVASISLLPVGLIGLIVVAILAATMSSMDTGLNTNVAILIKDVYPKISRRLRWRSKGESELLNYGRTLTWIMGFIIVLLALYFAQQDGSGIFGIMLQVGTLLSMPITIPLLLGMFIRQTPWWSALFSIGCALIFSGLAFFEVPLIYLGFSQAFSDGFEWNFQQQFFGVLGTGTFGFLVSTLFAPSQNSAHRQMVDKFFSNMRTPIDFEKEVGEGNDLSQLTAIGRFGVAVAGFIALMLIIPNPLEGRVVILILAVTIGIISILMLKAGKEPINSDKDAPS